MSETTAATHIKQVWTIGIPVSDQDRALAFYQGTLGFEVRMDAAYGPGQRWIEVAPPGARTTVALVRTEPGDPIGVDTGIRFATGDAAADHVALKGRGVDVDDEVIPYPVPMFVMRDPDGNRLIMVEATPQG